MRAVLKTFPGGRLRWGVAIAAGFSVYALWLAFGPPGTLLNLLGMFGALAARVAATVALLRRIRRLDVAGDPRPWRLFGAGLVLWTAGAGLEVAIRVVSGQYVPVPSIPDWLRAAGALAALTGAISQRPSAAERFGRVREFLDVAILAVAVAGLAWLLFIRSALAVGLGTPIDVLWTAVGPALDLALIGLFGRHLLRAEHRDDIRLFGLLGLGAVGLAAGDLADGFRRLLAESSSVGVAELAWMAGGLLFLAASDRLGSPRTGQGASRPPLSTAAHRIESLLPIAFTYAVVGTVVADWWSNKQLDWFLVASAAGLSLLLMARQGVIIGQVELRQFAALVTSSADLSFICDKDGRLLLANPAMASGVGLPQSAVLGLTLDSLVEATPPVREVLGLALGGGWAGEARVRRRAGNASSFPVFLSLRPIRDERRDEPLLAGTAHDLTLVKRRETELEQALDEIAAARSDLQALNAELEQKVQDRTRQLERTVADLGQLNAELQQLDRLKSEFVALVTHELRAPLTNIRSGIELVLGRHSALGESAEHSLRLVQLETERLTKFVETILDLSALEAGRFPLDLRSLDLGAVTEEVLAQFPGLARVKREIPAELPRVRADEAGLKSILHHLLDNAIKYAPEGELTLAAVADDGRVEVSLSDSGPGVPAPERERIFEMFHRLDARDEREVYGHGLGLPMVRRLVVAMGGEVRVEPSGSEGARFVFWLPAVAE